MAEPIITEKNISTGDSYTSQLLYIIALLVHKHGGIDERNRVCLTVTDEVLLHPAQIKDLTVGIYENADRFKAELSLPLFPNARTAPDSASKNYTHKEGSD